MSQKTISERPESKVNAMERLSQDFLWALKQEESAARYLEQIAGLDPEALARALPSDAEKKAFWINLYNGFNLHLMREDPSVNAQPKSRMQFFLRRQITVAGKKLSLMDIENGILRRSKVWWGLGYIPRFRISRFEKKMRVKTLDARLHFALNCGAVSCPPIRFYSTAGIDAELDLATRAYLSTEVRPGTGKEEGILYISSLFRAYRGDFRTEGGIMDFIQKYRELPRRKWKQKFIAWNSATDLDDFVD